MSQRNYDLQNQMNYFYVDIAPTSFLITGKNLTFTLALCSLLRLKKGLVINLFFRHLYCLNSLN